MFLSSSSTRWRQGCGVFAPAAEVPLVIHSIGTLFIATGNWSSCILAQRKSQVAVLIDSRGCCVRARFDSNLDFLLLIGARGGRALHCSAGSTFMLLPFQLTYACLPFLHTLFSVPRFWGSRRCDAKSCVKSVNLFF
jgi:hypothetical protein